MHNQKFFRVRWVGGLELGHFVKDFVKNTRKKGSAGKHFGVFSAEFFGHTGTCTGTRTLTKVLESAPSDRKTDKS